MQVDVPGCVLAGTLSFTVTPSRWSMIRVGGMLLAVQVCS